MNDRRRVEDQIRGHGIRREEVADEATLALAVSWLGTAERLRAAVETLVDPSVGPVTAYTHRPERTGH